VARHPGAHPALLHRGRLGAGDAGGGPQRRAQHAEGGAGPDRIAAAGDELELVPAPQRPLQELAAQPGLAHARRRRHQHRARHRLARALGVHRQQGPQLPLAPHAGELAPKQVARRIALAALAQEACPPRRRRHLQAVPHQGHGHVVEEDGAGLLPLHQHGGAIDDLSHRQVVAHHGPPRAHRHHRVGQARAQSERAASGVDRLIGGRAAPEQADEEGAAREAIDPRADPQLGQGLAHHPRRLLAAIGVALALSAGGRRRRPEHDGGEDPLLEGQHRPRRVQLRRRELPRLRDGGSGDPLGDAGQLVDQRRRAGRAVLPSLGQHAGKQLDQRRGDVPAQGAHVDRLEADLHHDRQRRLAGEGRGAAQALDDQRRQREHVRARVERAIAACLLRRHVKGRPQGHPGAGKAVGVEAPGDAEVEQLDVRQRAPGQEEVGGLEVAVHHPALVGEGQRVQHPPRQLHGGEQPQTPAGEPLLQRLAVQPLHGQVRLARGGHAVLDVADDGRMAELRQQHRLLLEAIGRHRPLAVHHLERHHPTRRQVAGAIDGGHAAASGGRLHAEAIAIGERRGGDGHRYGVIGMPARENEAGETGSSRAAEGVVSGL
jgi:hypothetical protein